MPETLTSRLLRRAVTLPVFLLGALLATTISPVLIPAALLLSGVPRYAGAARTVGFAIAYLWCETVGILCAGWLWLRYRFPRMGDARYEAFLRSNYRLQCSWSSALKRSAETIFRLRFETDGAAALKGGGAIVLARHASMADTIIPMVFYAVPMHIRLRYVLKRELLLDPCLDIVGNRLPNCFVDRDSDDAGPEIARVAQLAEHLAQDEGVLIYPEGARFSAERRQRAIERLAPHVPAAELTRMQRWHSLLPPRLGGTLALLAANPARDLVFCAHTGFEGSTHFGNLWNGAWTGSTIRIRFWRVPFLEIPKDEVDRRAFLFAQWDRMQDTVDQLR